MNAFKFNFAAFLTLALIITTNASLFAPYIDITKEGPKWTDVAAKTGVKSFTVAFILAGIHGECDATWGAMYPLNDPYIMGEIRAIKAMGGEIIVAVGGAVGPYLEMSCLNSAALLQQYKNVLDFVGTTHLDVDIETSFNFDIMSSALAQLQRERPEVSIGYTLVVQSDDYGLNIPLGTDIIKSALKHGVRIDTINPMAMEFWTEKKSWGDAVVAVGETLVKQMREFWPQRSDAELYRMLGVTPMIGRNYNGKIFEPSHATQLVNWANTHQIAFLGFWAVGRDNGGCPAGTREPSPYCSGTAQGELEFTKIFSGFKGSSVHVSPVDNRTQTQTPVTTLAPKVTGTGVDCSRPDSENKYFIYAGDCSKYIWCYDSLAHVETCFQGTIWDNDNHACNWPELVNRMEC